MNPKDQTLKINEKNLLSDSFLNRNFSDLNLFIKDKNFLFITKKTERLVSAIYLLTDLFPDQEPLKWSLRKCSLNIISHILAIKSHFVKKNLNLNTPNSYILELHSFLETAYMSGLISSMNFSILKNEILKLMSIEEQYSIQDNQKDKTLNEKYFAEDYKGHFEENINLPDKSQRKAIDGNVSDFHKQSLKKQTNISEDLKKNVIHGSDNKPVFLENVTEKKEKKNKRQIKIIDLIRSKKTVSIKDISDNIQGCSEKTIQRELLSMVHSGILKKEGERRWSRYSLNL